MLGAEIQDPFGVEEGGSISGMNLLPVKTVFHEEKHRTRVRGTMSSSLKDSDFPELAGMNIEGYEIHMGATSSIDDKIQRMCSIKAFDDDDYILDGYHRDNIFGTYVHGIFETPNIAEAIVKSLAEKKGVDAGCLGKLSASEYKEMQYNKLADILRKNLDMNKIYEILEAGI